MAATANSGLFHYSGVVLGAGGGGDGFAVAATGTAADLVLVIGVFAEMYKLYGDFDFGFGEEGALESSVIAGGS